VALGELRLTLLHTNLPLLTAVLASSLLGSGGRQTDRDGSNRHTWEPEPCKHHLRSLSVVSQVHVDPKPGPG